MLFLGQNQLKELERFHGIIIAGKRRSIILGGKETTNGNTTEKTNAILKASLPNNYLQLSFT